MTNKYAIKNKIENTSGITHKLKLHINFFTGKKTLQTLQELLKAIKLLTKRQTQTLLKFTYFDIILKSRLTFVSNCSKF